MSCNSSNDNSTKELNFTLNEINSSSDSNKPSLPSSSSSSSSSYLTTSKPHLRSQSESTSTSISNSKSNLDLNFGALDLRNLTSTSSVSDCSIDSNNENKKNKLKHDSIKEKIDEPSELELAPHQPHNQREIDNRSVYVSNIPFKISPWKLNKLFSNGTDVINGTGEKSVNRVTIVCDRLTGLPKGFAYVEFSNESHANDAILFDGVELDGRVIGVAKKRTNIPGLNDNNEIESLINKAKEKHNENDEFNENNEKNNSNLIKNIWDNKSVNRKNNNNIENNQFKKYNSYKSQGNYNMGNKNFDNVIGSNRANKKAFNNKDNDNNNNYNKYNNYNNKPIHSNSNYNFIQNSNIQNNYGKHYKQHNHCNAYCENNDSRNTYMNTGLDILSDDIDDEGYLGEVEHDGDTYDGESSHSSLDDINDVSSMNRTDVLNTESTIGDDKSISETICPSCDNFLRKVPYGKSGATGYFQVNERGRGNSRHRGNISGRGRSGSRNNYNNNKFSDNSHYRDSTRGNGRGRYRGRGKNNYNKNYNSNPNSNSDNSNRNSTSKFVIDENHYLTPSSRVGVYNQ